MNETYPPILIKALNEPGSYRLKTKCGDQITFKFAERICREWVRLLPQKNCELRVSEIVWIMEDPTFDFSTKGDA
jgi:hypothetical protein